MADPCATPLGQSRSVPLVFLVRLAPPSNSDTIHLNTCRYVRRRKVVPWSWADTVPKSEWASVPWLNYCKCCHPERLGDDE